LYQNQHKNRGVLLLILMRKRIVSKSTQKPGFFVIDFDAQAHCIKINTKTGVFIIALIQKHDIQCHFIFGCINHANML